MELGLDLSLTIELAAIILSVAAILLTVIGFFASIRFYRDGVQLQSRVRELVSRVDEKVASVQSQVGGMFEKTLDAVIGLSTPQVAAEEQRRLIRQAGKTHEPEATPNVQLPQTVPEDLPSKVMDYLAFKKLRYTDVTTGDARAVFMLGAGHGFNLFDSPSTIVFLGYFHDLTSREIVARVRFFFNNIAASYKRIETADTVLKNAAKQILDMISVELLVPEDADPEQLATAIAQYQPSVRQIDLAIHKPSEILDAVEAEYENMGF